MQILIGNTGLIGQTLKETINFDLEFNSKNIREFSKCDISNSTLYLSCLPATKWKVNQNIDSDLNTIYQIYNIIKSHTYKKVILFSTIDVYNSTPIHADEATSPVITKLCYGSNRYLFELLIQTLNCSNIQIYRLPALFGNGIKKNILFDLLHNHNVGNINVNSTYQWFNLDKLTTNIHDIDQPGTYNLFTEPIRTSEIIKLFDVNINNGYQHNILYDYKTLLHQSGYIQDSNSVLVEIKKFIDVFRNKSLSV
jgi:hypothetical protein